MFDKGLVDVINGTLLVYLAGLNSTSSQSNLSRSMTQRPSQDSFNFQESSSLHGNELLNLWSDVPSLVKHNTALMLTQTNQTAGNFVQLLSSPSMVSWRDKTRSEPSWLVGAEPIITPRNGSNHAKFRHAR